MLINLVGLAVWVIVIIDIRLYGKHLSALQAVILSLAAIATPIILLEWIFLKTYRRTSTGLNFSVKKSWNLCGFGVKLLGFYTTLGVVTFIYWLFPEYQGSFYDTYFIFLKAILPWLCMGAVPYFILVDHFMTQPHDGYWHTGMLILGQWKKICCHTLRQHLLGWLVKAFFLALMFTYCVQNMNYIRNCRMSNLWGGFNGFYHFVYNTLFVVDVLFATVGYIVTLRIFDSHIRSTEPTLLGWYVTLECYEPFWSFSSRYYFKYTHNYDWNQWLQGYPILYMVWGAAILFTVFVYVYSTIPFGIRFSNLTNRGILTNGPYRFCKHPAYVSKTLSWWLISIPFLAKGGVVEALRLSLLLLGVNLFYFLRARTEERHLSRDPVYVEYAMIMNERSIFAWVGKLIPLLQYKKNKLFNTSNE